MVGLMFKGKQLRSWSLLPSGLDGLEQPSKTEIADAKLLLWENLAIKIDNDQVFYNLNPTPEEGEQILKHHVGDANLIRILDRYGFVSPAVIIIEAYVDFFMARYWEGKSESDVRDGLKAEKTFDLILQNMALSFNYPEPVRDWREGHGAPFIQSTDFYVPTIGKLEVKSVNRNRRVNFARDRWLREQPDYIVALMHLESEYVEPKPKLNLVLLCGAMTREKVHTYVGNPEFDKSGEGDNPDYLTIPVKDFDIKSITLYKALVEVKKAMEHLPHIPIKADISNNSALSK